jgi:MSHA pilin protein MshA
MKMNNVKKQQGFTLIELVVVIVILGILAVTAAPKFINLQDDAQTATLEGVKAAMESASALVHSKSLIAGNNDAASTDSPTPTVVINSAGLVANINYGYPTDVVADWAGLISIDTTNDFTIAQGTDSDSKTFIIIYPLTKIPTDVSGWKPGVDPSADANCFSYYYTPAAKFGEPDIGSVSCQVP